MKATRAVGYNTGIAAEYFVLSQLFRLGIEAYVSLGNKKAIDIRLVGSDGIARSIDVKAVRGYSSLPVNNIAKAMDHFIVCVFYNDRFEHLKSLPETFIIPSWEIEECLSYFGDQTRILKRSIDARHRDNWAILRRAVASYPEDEGAHQPG